MSSVTFFSWLLACLFGLSISFMFSVMYSFDPMAASGAAGGFGRKTREWRFFIKLIAPIMIPLGAMLSSLPSRFFERTEIKLIAAGRPGSLTVHEFSATKIIGLVFGLLVGLFIDNEMRSGPVFAVGMGTLGVLYPGIVLNGLLQRRRRRIFRDLPDMLDTLRLAVEAGLDLSSAMGVMVERGRKGPLHDELEMVERDMRLGRTRREALSEFADRVDMSEVRALVLALNQADQLGASIGPILKVQAEMARTRRWQLAEALVNKMPMKMMGPLVVFIFPSSFIILFTPLLIQWMQSS